VIVERYRDADAAAWNAFIAASRNGTFLFDRGYMDYHRDRFADHSMMVRSDEGELLAMLPANSNGQASRLPYVGQASRLPEQSGCIASHNGLSFGGLVIGPRMTTPLFLHAFEAVLIHLNDAGFTTLDYKTIPHIYHRQPADEDRYALFLLGATLTRRDILSVVSREDRLPYQSRRTRGIKKAQVAGVVVDSTEDFSEYWQLLTQTLADRHGAVPVHSLAEIGLLRDCFPLNIRLHTARANGELLAGVVTYQSDRVAHAQYIASSPAGREVSALDLVFDHLIHDVSRDSTYFDFGGSHEDGGRAINTGLIEQKEGFGARAMAHDHYRIDLATIHAGILTGALR
jgi:Acetyltransferase (GNAT) domain